MDPNFNWDDIDIGDLQLDHSQNFFAKKHIKHEKLENDEELEQKNITTNNKNNATTDTCDNFKENYAENTNKEIPNTVHIKQESPQKETETTSTDVKQKNDETPKKTSQELIENYLISEEDYILSLENIKIENELPMENVKETQSANNMQMEPKKNLRLEWSTVQAGKTEKNVACPKAYLFKDIYKHKLEEARHKRTEEEKKMREFHSRPVPDFKKFHKKIERPLVHHVTIPETPDTLKNWRATQEKRKKKLQEYLKEQEMKKTKPKSLTYLQKEPFQPKKVPNEIIQSKPFKLQTDQRVQERREYNATISRALEEKSKQEEEERCRREKREFEELRKMTQFKARPNPFK